jgi:acetylornithine deacetylase
MDTVPPSKGQDHPFTPRVVDGAVYGRGACDDKGQIAVIYLLLSIIKSAGIKPGGDIEVHLVVEEENGGNGTLAMAREGVTADGALVMEASNLNVVVACRGVLWFRITCRGDAMHSGMSAVGPNALENVIRIMGVLKDYHRALLDESRGTAPFEDFDNPMPLTFGRLSAGDWPAMVPDRAVVEGVIGFLPNKSHNQLRQEIHDILARECGEEVMKRTDLEVTFAHDPSLVSADHPLVRDLLSACQSVGASSQVTVLTASTDASFYSNWLSIPTVVFGPGHLRFAHSKDEQISMPDVSLAARALLRFVENWCGCVKR